jgi:hypothetical protein
MKRINLNALVDPAFPVRGHCQQRHLEELPQPAVPGQERL